MRSQRLRRQPGEAYLHSEERSLLPAGGLVGSGSARERQLALHKWAVSLAGLREEAVMGIRKIHRAKAVMNEQKMQEQTRLLDQLKLLLRSAKGSLDGHLAALTDLNQDATVLLQELAQALHDLRHDEQAMYFEAMLRRPWHECHDGQASEDTTNLISALCECSNGRLGL